MRGIPKILLSTGLLVLSLLMLAGCGRRNLPLNRPGSGIVVFQLDKQKPQMSQMTPTQGQSAISATNSPTAPTATPQPAGNTAKTTAPDTDIDELMDELESTLNELEASITAADKDTLTDSALVALGN